MMNGVASGGGGRAELAPHKIVNMRSDTSEFKNVEHNVIITYVINFLSLFRLLSTL